MTITILEEYPGAAGFIPSFLSESDARPAIEQLDAAYGWVDMPNKDNFTLTAMKLVYHDGQGPDEEFPVKAAVFLRNEVVLIYHADLVVVRQSDGTWRISRMT